MRTEIGGCKVSDMENLSKNLKPIYDYELAQGNEVVGVDVEAWSRCPLAIYFRDPLHVEGIVRDLPLAPTVSRWENRDTHYPLEIGYVDSESNHSISGPIPGELHPDASPHPSSAGD